MLPSKKSRAMPGFSSVPATRVAVEAGVTDWWRKYVGLEGAVVGIDRFGECGPAAQVFEYLGVTAAKVTEAVETVIAA